jgi:hypothetical protein
MKQTMAIIKANADNARDQMEKINGILEHQT